MYMQRSTLGAAIALALCNQMSVAGTGPYFIPLTAPNPVEQADGAKVIDNDNVVAYISERNIDELNKPWDAPAGVTQRLLTNMEEIEADMNQSIVRVDNGQNSSMWDMNAYDPTGRYLFIPHETTFGAGVSRYDSQTDTSEILLKGDETRTYENDTDFGAFDPVRWTPNGTLIAAEEWAGIGRMVEICDPLGPAPANPNADQLTQGDCQNDANADYRIVRGVALTSQEGIDFSLDAPNDVVYYVDEDRSGSIYKTVFTNTGDYSEGQTFVLSVDSYLTFAQNYESQNGINPAAERYDRTPNSDDCPLRTGPATWVPITDANGNPLPGVQDPHDYQRVLDTGDTGRSGLEAADDVYGTPYGRPEDTTISRLANGNETLFFTATSENAVYGVEMTGEDTARVFTSVQGPSSVLQGCGVAETPKNVGFPNTTANLGAPDNLAQDSLGNIYIIEDAPNNGTPLGGDGGDVWFARDINNDGVAESIDHFLSLQVSGSEHTGMIFNPTDPTKFTINIQHPRSTILSDDDNLVADTADDGDGVRSSEGAGDAVWEFDLANVAPPACTADRRAFMTFDADTRRWVRACSSQRDFNAVDMFDRSNTSNFPTP